MRFWNRRESQRRLKSFIEQRRANTRFDDYESEIQPLVIAGLAQGSPLSQILFPYFNADLVDQRVDHKSGSSSIINDYFRGHIGRTEEEILEPIQHVDIPRTLTWAHHTGSQFAVKKTKIIQFSRRRKKHHNSGVTISGTKVLTSPSAKLLGVVLNEELQFKEHVDNTVARPPRSAQQWRV
jgi:hypothetical protein